MREWSVLPDMRRIAAKLVTGMMPGRIGAVMPAASALSRKRKKASRLKEELGDRAAGPGIELALEVVEIGLGS